jgi:hypothetical protein
MFLHELKRGDKIYVELVDQNSKTSRELITFDHLDCMYSVCYTKGKNIINLYRYTPLKKVGRYYQII